jgi:hypothetical protein
MRRAGDKTMTALPHTGGSWLDHVEWAVGRAREYLPAEPRQAVQSLTSDLGKCPETQPMAFVVGGLFTRLLLLGKGPAVIAAALDELLVESTALYRRERREGE